MAEIILDKQFVKNFGKKIKGNKSLEKKYEERIDLFLHDRKNSILKDHQLQGNMRTFRSFSVAGDYRIIYYEKDENIIFIFVDIGSHNQVY